MTIDQAKSTITQIENIFKSDIDKKIAEFYKDQSEIGKITIQRLTINEFISLTKRVLKQIEKEVNSENRFVLPYTHNVIEIGQFQLDNAISILNSQISSNQLASAENYLFWLCQYSINNGFFDKSKYKMHSIDSLKLQEQKDNLELLKENFKQLNERYKQLVQGIENTKTEINNYYQTKQEEFVQISNNLITSTNQTNSINELHNQSTLTNSKITTLQELIEKEKNKIEKLNEETTNKFNELKDSYSKSLATLIESDKLYKTNNENFTKRLSFVEEKTDFFNERNEYLNNLIGREVGASLFETFKQRKTELNDPLNFWKWAVTIMGGLTFVIVLAIFTNLFGILGDIPTNYNWELIIVNFIKSTPFFFLLYYSISQYNKERNFQEEYAFKSASALTIKAYSDILIDDANKDQLILKAVYNIYKSPTATNKNNVPKKDINNITDLLSQVVEKSSEILKREK